MTNDRTTKLTPDDALEAARASDAFYLISEELEDNALLDESAEPDDDPYEGGKTRLRYVIDEHGIMREETIA